MKMTRIQSINTSLFESSTDNVSKTFLEYLGEENKEWKKNSTDNLTNTFLHKEFEELKWLDFFECVRIIVPIVFGLITITGIVGNILTIAVVLRHKGIKSITDILIINLAVADLLFIVVCVPFRAAQFVMWESPFENVLIKILTYFIQVFTFASVYILVLMALDKYIGLVHPYRALSLRSKRKCYIILAVIWSIAVIGNMPLIFTKQLSIQIVLPILFVFGFMLPGTVMCVLHVNIMKTFHTGNTPGVNNSTSCVRLQSKQRVTKMVLTVVIVFIIFTLPSYIVLLYLAFEDYVFDQILCVVLLVTESMTYLNSCINLALYSFYSKSFRKECMDLLKCKKKT